VEKCCREEQATDDNMAHARYLRLETHSESVRRLYACSWQPWLHERASCYIMHILPVLFNFQVPICGQRNRHGQNNVGSVIRPMTFFLKVFIALTVYTNKQRYVRLFLTPIEYCGLRSCHELCYVL
jgi:hypothetical protein